MREQPKFSDFGPAGPVRRQVKPVSRRMIRVNRSYSANPTPRPVTKAPAQTAQANYAKVMFPEKPTRRWETSLPKAQSSKKRIKTPDLSTWVRRQTKPQFAILGAAAFIFVTGLVVSIMGFRTNSHVEAQTKKLSQAAVNSEDAGDHPDETNPGPNAAGQYSVAPDHPKRIMIPRLKVNARIMPMGTKKNNELKAPANIYDAGWFEQSAKPGAQQGATLIDGHVHGPTKPGVFYELKKLGVGDTIQIERGDGKVFKYEVVRTQTYNRHNMDMQAAVTTVDPALPGLNLITCTGKLDKENNTYTERLLVQAVLVD